MTNFFNLIHKSLKVNSKKELILWTEDGNVSIFTGEVLLKKINSFRSQIQKAGINKGEMVIPAIPISVDTFCALLAVQSLGMIPVSPPAKLSIFNFIILLKKQKISALILKKKPNIFTYLILKFIGVTAIIKKNSDDEIKDWQAVQVSSELSALISFTSGSTGKPKAIYRSHGVLTNQHLILKKAFPPFEGQKDFPLFPNILLHNLASGVSSVMPEIAQFKLENMNPKLIVNQIKNQTVNSMTGNVFYFTRLLAYLQHQPQFFPEVKAIGIGGSPVPEKLIKSIQHFFNKADCYIIYGSSEAEPIAVRKVDSTIQNPLNGFYVGKPLDNILIKVNEELEIKTPQGAYKSGEIQVKGEHVACTKNAWLKTGDYGYLNQDNDLFLTARKGNETAHSGFQHYQIEHLLLQEESVEKVAVIAVANGFNVFVKGEIKKDEIWKVIKVNLPNQLIKSVIFKDEIPVDVRHHSKILYEKLK